MPSDKQLARQDRIKAAAYALLKQKGYGATSMLSIAKAAKASNETLYRWYGSKQQLFMEMARDNATHIKTQLEDAYTHNQDPQEALQRIGPILLTMLLSDQVILLNRAAACDPTSELGIAIREGGRDQIIPLILQLIKRAQDSGHLKGSPPEDAAQLFVTLLVGDLQLRYVIAKSALLTDAQIDARAKTAWAQFIVLTQS